MKKEIADQWIAALRSGKYQQTKGRLRNGDEFCCLGVLCDISQIEEWKNRGNLTVYGGKLTTSLPKSVMEWAGLYDPFGTNRYHENEMLSIMNDEGTSFNAIADYIEVHWEEL